MWRCWLSIVRSSSFHIIGPYGVNKAEITEQYHQSFKQNKFYMVNDARGTKENFGEKS